MAQQKQKRFFQKQLKQSYTSKMLIIKKFGATWCNPCKALEKVMDEIMPSYNTAVTLNKIDVEEDVDEAEKYQIRGVPTIIFEVDGKIVERIVGLRSGSEIKKIIDQYVK